MIEKIVVHECSYDENGTRRQDIIAINKNRALYEHTVSGEQD